MNIQRVDRSFCSPRSFSDRPVEEIAELRYELKLGQLLLHLLPLLAHQQQAQHVQHLANVTVGNQSIVFIKLFDKSISWDCYLDQTNFL
jgi:hypothetical protein